MQQLLDNTNAKVTLTVMLVLTIYGTDNLYKLSDNAYGEWLILKKGKPKYYFNLFDKLYEQHINKLKNKKDIEGTLAKGLLRIKTDLHINRNLKYIFILKKSLQEITLEKLPVTILEKITREI